MGGSIGSPASTEVNMKRFLFLLLFLMSVSSFLHAWDDFLLLQRQLQDVSREWERYSSPERRNLLLGSSDLKARKLLKFRYECIDNFLATSRKIQKDLKGVKAADGLALVRHAEHLRGILQLCAGGVENEISTATQNRKELLTLAFQLVKTDQNFLKELGFSDRSGIPAVSAEAKAWPELYQFKRQLQMLKIYLDNDRKFTQMGLTAQKKEFLREFSSIAEAADRLGNKTEQEFPELTDTAVMLSVVTRKLLEEARLSASSARLKNASSSSSSSPSSSSSGDSRSTSKRLQQIDHLLQMIEKQIRIDLESRVKSSAETPEVKKEEPVCIQPEPERNKKTSDSTPKKEKRVPIERRSEEELNGELTRLRQQILPDPDRDSFSDDELDQCLDLLSEREKKQYETIRLRQIRNGISERDAPLEAMKELKEILSAPGAALPAKQEKVRILKKVMPETAE